MAKEEMIRLRCTEKQKGDWQLRAEAAGAKNLTDWILSKLDTPDVAPQPFANGGMAAPAPEVERGEAVEEEVSELEKMVSRKIGHTFLCDCDECERFRDYLKKKLKEAESEKKAGKSRKS